MTPLQIAKCRIVKRTAAFAVCLAVLLVLAFVIGNNTVKDVFATVTFLLATFFAIFIGDAAVAYFKLKKSLKSGEHLDEEDPRKA